LRGVWAYSALPALSLPFNKEFHESSRHAESSAKHANTAAGCSIARWDYIELNFAGPYAGNPFLDVSLSATFRINHRSLEVAVFYDGAGSCNIRFMPDEPGAWSWATSSNAPALDGKSGAFQCLAPEAGNRGPVSVRDTFHFGYADGTQCFRVSAPAKWSSSFLALPGVVSGSAKRALCRCRGSRFNPWPVSARKVFQYGFSVCRE
jgi:hypothetical protein